MSTPMTDPVACMACSALVRRQDMDAHRRSHDGEAEAARRTAEEVLQRAMPDIVEKVVLALMKGGSN